MVQPLEAFERLLEGNRRFASGEGRHGLGVDEARRLALVPGQEPFAAVLSCADSRVPPEHVFDVGLGELFVCRNAGNQLDELTLGSIEFAIADTGCPLVAVLGHAGCGACTTAVAAAKEPERSRSPGLDDVVRRLSPALMATSHAQLDDRSWIDAVSRKNVELVCRQLLQRSRILADGHRRGTLEVVGLWYDLGSGRTELVVPIVDESDHE